MAPIRSILASRPVLAALSIVATLALYISTLDHERRHELTSKYAHSFGVGNSGGPGWHDASLAYVKKLGGAAGARALGVYPGRKPRTIRYQLEKAEERYKDMLRRRRETLGLFAHGTDKFEPWHTMMYFWFYFPPAFICPHEIERIGPLEDGGKWICGMNLYEEQPRAQCTIYSFGVNYDSRFEAEMLDRTDCQVFAYDASVTQLSPEARGHPRAHFKPYFIGREDKVDQEKNITWKTLRSIMQENGHDWIDILKVDIEGSEFGTFRAIMEDFPEELPFTQLQIEVHVREDFVSFDGFLEWWEKLEQMGVYPWWTEINLNPALHRERPWASEYCFLNTRGGKKNLLIQNY